MEKWLIANPVPFNSTSCNKDLNGGYGTVDNIGSSIISRLLGRIKKKSIKLPVLSLGYISAILSLKELRQVTPRILLKLKIISYLITFLLALYIVL